MSQKCYECDNNADDDIETVASHDAGVDADAETNGDNCVECDGDDGSDAVGDGACDCDCGWHGDGRNDNDDHGGDKW